MKRVALCIPTYNRPEVIEELLVRYHKTMANIGYDLFIYDSSENEDTQRIVEKYSQINDHVFYKGMSSDIHSNKKVFEIYKEPFLKKEYRYIWVCSDSVRLSDDAYRYIYDELEETYDYVVPNPRDEGRLETKTYTDYTKAFYDFGWHTQLYGSVIVNTQTVLTNVEWNKYEEKWLTEDCINYSHVGFYFERMAELRSEKIRHLSLNPDDYSSSPLRKHSGWRNDTFLIICEIWPNVIKTLPECYNNQKRHVIRMGCEKSGIIGDRYLMDLKREGIYNPKIVMKYWSRWSEITNISRWMLLKLSLMRVKVKHTEPDPKLENMRRELIEFSKKYKRIYIYGCGYIGAHVAEYLEKWGMDYEAFIVTDSLSEKKTFYGHKVIEYDKKIFEDQKSGCVIGLNKKYVMEIIDTLKSDGVDKYLYISFLSKDIADQ